MRVRTFEAWQAVISGTFALAAIGGGFMLEKLFLEEWPWWAWGIVAIAAIALGILASWMQSRQLAKRTLEWKIIAYYSESSNKAEEGLAALVNILTAGLFSSTKRIPRLIQNTMTGEICELSVPDKPPRHG